jgi:hypothetical protein
MRQTATTSLAVLYCLLLATGCDHSTRNQIKNTAKLQTIWSGLSSYRDEYGKLPSNELSPWRLSEESSFSTVCWRGHVVERVAAIGNRDRVASRNEVDEQIHNVADELFVIEDMVVCLNQPVVDRLNAGNADSDAIVAFSMPSTTRELLTDCVSVSFDDAMSATSETGRRQIRQLYVLYADGSVGIVSLEGQGRSVQKQVSPSESAAEDGP